MTDYIDYRSISGRRLAFRQTPSATASGQKYSRFKKANDEQSYRLYVCRDIGVRAFKLQDPSTSTSTCSLIKNDF